MSDLPTSPTSPTSNGLVVAPRRMPRRRLLLALAAIAVVLAIAIAAGGLRYYQVQHEREARIARNAEIAAARARVVAAARARGVPIAAAAVAATNAAARKPARVADANLSGSLFTPHSWYVAPPPPPYVPPPRPPPPPPPMAPPLPYVFLGSYTPNGDATVFFLTRGDRVYDVKVGDTVDGIYQIDSATSGQLVFNYKPLNQRQMMSIGVTP